MNSKYTNTEKKDLMKKVRTLRKRGMSVAEISKIIGVSTNLIYEWINYGINPSHPKETDIIALKSKGMSLSEIAKKLGTYPRIIKSIIENMNADAFSSNNADNSISEKTDASAEIMSQEIRKDGTSVITKTISRAKDAPALTPEELIDIFGLDTSRWELVTSKMNTWNGMTRADENGNNGKMELYQVSITVKPLKHGTLSFEDIKNFFEKNKFIREKEDIKFAPVDNGYILNIPLADWHLGLLASKSTSGEIYNCEIAKNLLKSAITRIIQNTKGMPISKISFVTLGEVLHVDNSNYTTTRGTQQQMEKPLGDTFDEAFKTLTWVIDTLSEELKAPLEYIYIPGNHDKDTGCGLAYAIGGRYATSANITTDCTPLPFKSRMYGDTLVGYHHGDANIKNLQTYLINDEKEAYGTSKKAIMKVGHLHHFEVNAKGAVPVEFQPALCGASAWEYQQGYSSERGIRYTLYSTNSTSCIDGFVSVDDIENN